MKLMLHMCCAPCAVAIVDKLQKQPDITLDGFFYNPNIHPTEEYEKRRAAVVSLSQAYEMPIAFEDENGLAFWQKKLNGEKDVRCNTCYAIRMDKAAQKALEKGCDAFTTSLLISPYQNHELIRALGEKAAAKYGIGFYYEDFRDLYRKGRELSRAKGWYMQKYCGCAYSYTESDHPKKPIYLFE
ncbi:MAG: epoxyqueuosine reductase QueH [Clostridia bacterium]|nr:epoxyqueuosine reductase QueH [Clostridia bacterium]